MRDTVAFLLVVSWLYLMPLSSSGQERKVRMVKKKFQAGLFPGIGSNGIRSGSYINNFSFNLFGGLSGSNRIFEFSPISNVELQSTTGIQIAGLANIIGPNTFVNLTIKEESDLMHAAYTVNEQGIQVAGLLNYVLNDGGGIQLSGALNVVGDDYSGVQLAGIGNGSGGYVIGFQMASVFNIARESMTGWQISSLMNFTAGEMSGIQFAAINKATLIDGKKSTPPTSARGMQIGVLNFCKTMNGVQVGLINFAGPIRGKQFGLINFFSTISPMERVRAGTPVGLLNFGSTGSITRIHYNELYDLNFVWTSGNCLNCSRTMQTQMPFDDTNQIFNQNALLFGFDTRLHTWGFGYGFQKVLYNKFSMQPRPENKRRVITYGLNWLHLNRTSEVDWSKNLLTRLNFDYGRRYRWIYIFGGLSFNYFLHEKTDADDTYVIHSRQFAAGSLSNLKASVWPGYSAGIQF